jgi:DNA topoisomerase-1
VPHGDEVHYLDTRGRCIRDEATLARIRRRVQRDLSGAPQSHPTRTRLLATLVHLPDTTFVRIGNEDDARGNGSFGVTTLRARHAGVHDAEVRLSFKGKSGVRHEVALADRRVATVVRRCKALPGQELFQYADADGGMHKVTSADVNDYRGQVAGMRVTAKDFRTGHGSVMAVEFTRAACAGEPERGAATRVLERVAARLGNAVAVCRKAHVHPKVLALGALRADDAARASLLEPSTPRRARAIHGRRRERQLPDAQRPTGRQRLPLQGLPCRRSRIS